MNHMKGTVGRDHAAEYSARRAQAGFNSERARKARAEKALADRRRNQLAHRARAALEDGVRRGAVIRPETCERCGDAPRPRRDGGSSIHGHHADYGKPLDVEWLCNECHRRKHRERAA
jgi:hypothetical protein